MSKEDYIEKIRPHDSAYKHVSGYAEYTDDINEPIGTLYGARHSTKRRRRRPWPALSLVMTRWFVILIVVFAPH